MIAKELHSLNHPNEAIFIPRGEQVMVLFLYQLFVRQFGTNNHQTALICVMSQAVLHSQKR